MRGNDKDHSERLTLSVGETLCSLPPCYVRPMKGSVCWPVKTADGLHTTKRIRNARVLADSAVSTSLIPLLQAVAPHAGLTQLLGSDERPIQVCPVQMGLAQIRTAQVRSCQISIGEIGLAKIGLA
jgi:hypothetical protein